MANLKLRCIFFLIVSLFTLAGCGGGGSSQEVGSNSTNPPDDPVDPPAPPTTSNPTISSIQIVDTTTLATVQSVNQDTTIDLETLPDNFNFVAIPADEEAVESVEFMLEGCASIERTEIYPPYSLQDESIGLSSLPEGECSITAIPYSEDNLQGEEGPAYIVGFEVVGDTGVNSPPTINLNGPTTVSVPYGGSYVELATATDIEDGDLTSNIDIQGDNINTFMAGTYLITYLVADSAGATAFDERNVIVENEQLPQPPEITLNGSNGLFIEVNENFTDPGATAVDQYDVDITDRIVIVSDVDTSSVGEYTIVYSVEDFDQLTDEVTRDVTVVPSGSPSGNIDADIVSLTRVNGVSPETVYFNADESTCSDCTDLFGLNTAEADAYSVLSYHFNFDDSDSGTFDTTGNSRNVQISGSPRAAHTFHCFGPGDPNWVPNGVDDGQCEFDVGVRVQAAPDNDFDDAFIRVNIQPAVGVGGYYADSDVTCVSSTSDFADCLALAPGASTATDVPSIGNWNERLAIIDNNGGSYSTVCMGADEQNGAAIAYGPNLVSGAATGSRPITGTSILGARPGNCTYTYFQDSDISMLSDNWPERNGNGELIDGFGFGQKVVGMAVGRVRVGPTGHFIQYHDIAAGTPAGGSGEISVLSAAGGCRSSATLSCSNIPSASFIFITDTTSDGNPNNLPVAANIGCFNNCDLTNAVIMGTRTNSSGEHNVRFMGAWGLILANNWMQGDFIGNKGPKAQVTIRQSNDGSINDMNRDPEDLSSLSNYTFANNGNGDFVNRYLMSIDNRINQTSHASGHDGGAMHMIAGLFTIEDGTYYYADSASSAIPKVWMEGVYKVVRDYTVQAPSSIDCGFRTNIYANGSAVNQGNTFYYEGTPTCSGSGGITTGIAPLPTPAAPGS